METHTSTRVKFVVGALGLALLFGPRLAYVAGARSNPVISENRALAKRPSWRGFATLQDITNYTADHFPLRDNAIRANGKLGNVASSGGKGPGTAGVGGTVKPSPDQVIAAQTLKGKDGFLFFAEDFSRACAPETPLPEVLAGLKRLNSIITKSGRRLVVSIVPDKSAFETNLLPDRYPQQDCSLKAQAERRKKLAALRLPGLVDMTPVLKADEKQTGKPAYQALDTHWTDRSGALFVQAIAHKLDPALSENTELRYSHVGKSQKDLAIFAGDTSLHDDPVYELIRSGVTETVVPTTYVPAGAYETRRITATTTGPARLFTPKTFWIGDSFSDHAVHQYSKYFADLTEVPDLTKAKSVGHTSDGRDLYALMLPQVLDGIKNSEVVVLQAVERFFFGAKEGSLTSADFLNRLEAALR